MEEFTNCFLSKLQCNSEFIITVGSLENGQSGRCLEDLSICRENISQISHSVGADCTLLCRKHIDTSEFYIDEYLIRKKPELNDFQEVRIAVCGNVDSGKSTLLGVLTHCELDNGRGFARQKLFRHKHELETGTVPLMSRILSSVLIIHSPGRSNIEHWQ